jgi:DNA-binding NtrC family response regulator
VTVATPTPAAAPQTAPTALEKRRVLIAEDNEQVRKHLARLLQPEPDVAIDTTGNGKEALERLSASRPGYSIFLTDLKMPGMDGLELIEAVRQRNLPVTVIVMTGFGTVDDAVQAMQLGAYDFLTKPVDDEHLRLVVRRALRERALQDEVLRLRERIHETYDFHDVISQDPRMHGIFELISNVAHTTATVLIQGETGTGKEVVAKALHEASTAASGRTGPFVAVNCAALPETLLESELFGHEKGAFTGAVAQRRGRFEMAHGGTLFLDELGEIPLSIQAKLLRVLQERSIERVGGGQSIEVDLRLVAATNKPLARMVKQGKFREDLYYRVNVVRIDLPPLRQRADDVPLLAAHFAERLAPPGAPPKKIAPRALEVLRSYRWPGNIRQLANVIERACVVARGDTIEPEHLPPELTAPRKPKQLFQVDLNRPLPEQLRDMSAELERQYITKALEKVGGNVSRCAELCGLSRRSLTAKLGEYGIDRKEFKREE